MTIVGTICLVGALLVGGVFGIVTLCEHNDKAIEAEKVERLEKGLTADVEAVYSKNGIRQFEKFTFEGHAYLWHYQTGIIHLESCPCKNVEEEEKP